MLIFLEGQKYNFLLPSNHAEINAEKDTLELTNCGLYSEEELKNLRYYFYRYHYY